jgi:AAA15 family ATPase/GTPase
MARIKSIKFRGGKQMKLQRLYLENYQVLRKLEIYFSPHTENVLIRNPSYSLDFLVGVNGTGKSTVLRALFNLLKEIEDHNTVDYGFELEYEIGKGTNKRQIRLSNFPQETESEEFNSEQYLPLGELNIWENDEKIES